jgi:hypothetical protein
MEEVCICIPQEKVKDTKIRKEWENLAHTYKAYKYISVDVRGPLQAPSQYGQIVLGKIARKFSKSTNSRVAPYPVILKT